jgi:hypothetical protein
LAGMHHHHSIHFLRSGRERWFVAGIILLGAAIRLGHLAFIDLTFPFQYGGLFAEFSKQIIAHDFSLPRYIPYYTDGGIPFAYPPLAFYIEAVLVGPCALPEFLVATLLPPAVAILTLPVFFLLARESVTDLPTRLVALFAYAVMPAAFGDLIQGAGLPEALGSLALILLLLSETRAHRLRSIGSYCLAGLSWGLCVISSPGSAYASALTMLIFAAAQLSAADRRTSLRILGLLGATGLLAAAAASPYWLTVIEHHGIGVILDSFIGQHGHLLTAAKEALGRLAAFGVSGGQFPFWWDTLVFGGALWALIRRHWALVAVFVTLLSVPREGVWMVAIPAALLAALGIAEFFLPLLIDMSKSRLSQAAQVGVIGGIAVSFSVYALINPILTLYTLVNNNEGLSPATVEAMEWARDNTPEASVFVVLSRPQVKEWIPHVSRRTVLNMPFGSEWEPEEGKRIAALEALLSDCVDFDCVHAAVKQTMGYDQLYMFIDRNQLSDLELMSACTKTAGIASFELIWQNSETAIGRLTTRSAGMCGHQPDRCFEG